MSYHFILLFLPVFSRLDGKHVVFGLITSGLDILKKIEVSFFVFTTSYYSLILCCKVGAGMFTQVVNMIVVL